MDWLNDNAGAIQALSAVVLTGITMVYVVLTWCVIRAADRQRLAAVLPILMVDLLDGASERLTVQVRNVGTGPAVDVQLAWVPTELGANALCIVQAWPNSLILAAGETHSLDLDRNGALESATLAFQGGGQTLPLVAGNLLANYADVYGRPGVTETRLVWGQRNEDGVYVDDAWIETTRAALPSESAPTRGGQLARGRRQAA